jgi:predicted flap endonuclease-1-like 5' DNA nuclease
VTRRELLSFGLAVVLVLGGRLLREQLLIDSSGAWRDPGWLDSVLPPADDPAAAEPVPAPRTLQGPLAINVCSSDSLTLLPGVGPVLAARIAAVRAAGVHFASPADLQQVKGIGPHLAAKLAPWVTFDPGAGADTAAAQSAKAALPRVP